MRLYRVLCVDDSPVLLTSLELGLGHYGFELTTACDGADALMQFKTHFGQFDAILTDNEMSQMNGLELVRSVLNEGFKGHIVVMSGNFKPDELRLIRRIRSVASSVSLSTLVRSLQRF